MVGRGVTAVRPLPTRMRARMEGEEASRSPGELAGEGGRYGTEGVGRDGRRKDTPGREHSWSQGRVGQFWRGVASWQHRGLCVGMGWRGELQETRQRVRKNCQATPRRKPLPTRATGTL